jgi:hypothetical protein
MNAIGSAINTDSNNEHYVYNYTFLPYFANCQNDESCIQWMLLIDDRVYAALLYL